MEFTKDIVFDNNPTTNEFLTITYNGSLCKSDNVWLRFGFGENWENTNEIKMVKTENGFVTNVKLGNFDTFNFCFKDENNKWDNNCDCNYIASISPAKVPEIDTQEIEKLFDKFLKTSDEPKIQQAFDIDALIEEILQPVTIKKEEKIDNSPVEIESEPIDLGVQISNALSQIPDTKEEVVEYSSLNEILSASVVTETSVESLEEPILDELFETEETKIENSEVIETTKDNVDIETALINVDDPFSISPRKLSKFYLIRKKIKLAFYKALVKLPRLIFGTQEN